MVMPTIVPGQPAEKDIHGKMSSMAGVAKTVIFNSITY
jgi:hypothetical protein